MTGSCGKKLLMAVLFGICQLVSAQDVKMSEAEARAVLAGPTPARATSGSEALEAWKQREAAAQQLGQLDARIEALRQLTESAKDSESRFLQREKIFSAYERAGQFAKSVAERDEIINDGRIGPGRRAISAAGLANTMALGQEFARSERYMSRAKELAREAKADEIELLPNEPRLLVLGVEAVIASSQGDYGKALRISQQIIEQSSLALRDLTLSEKRRRSALNNSIGQVWNHELYLGRLGRRDEAIAFVTDAIRRASAAIAPAASQRQLANLEYSMAHALATAGDYEAALKHVNASLDKFKSAGGHEHENNFALARRLRGFVYLALGRSAEMQAEWEVVQAARSSNQTFAGNSSALEVDSLLALSSGRMDEAVMKSAERVADRFRWEGRDASSYKTARALEVVVRLSDTKAALPATEVQSYVDSLGSSETQWVDGAQRGTEMEAAALEKILNRFIDGPSAGQLAFRVAEVLRTDASQGALVSGAVKMAANTPELRDLIDKERAAISASGDKRRVSAIAATNTERLKKSGADQLVLKRQASDTDEKANTLAESDGRVLEIRRQIASKFPRYQELVSPRVPTSSEIAKVLKPDEVYVNLFPGREAGYAFVVLPSGELSAWKVPMTRQETTEAVRRYRRPFDASALPNGGGVTAGLDMPAGQRLYKAWMEQILAKVGPGKTIYVAASGPLAAVPWAALPLPSSGGDSNQVRWGVETADFVTMPSASSLVLTRSLPSTRAAKPMLAFADPSYDGKDAPVARGGDGVRRGAMEFADAQSISDFDYRRLNRLPDTLEEIEAISRAVGGDSGGIVSGVSATRSRVLKDDLSQARLLAFATHGLAPGEMPGFFSSGLAMAFEGSGLKDSILTVDDVANLRLNADLVLLSACNTGLASGGAGDTVSALARGFFVAGARSILVTAWAVESVSAKELTVGTFKAMQGSADSKAKALADTQRAMLGGKFGDQYRHPFFWAPYFLVGDAAR